MDEDVSTHLARNVRQLREARGLSQQKVATLCGVPRATWAHIESGAANPTLAVLVKVSGALRVSIEELIGPPRAAARLYRAGTLQARRRGGVTVRELLPEAQPGLQLERLELPAGAAMTGVPHTPGTREYLACERGAVTLSAGGETWRVSAGDVLVFRGDQKHAYRNEGRSLAVAYTVVALVPPSHSPA